MIQRLKTFSDWILPLSLGHHVSTVTNTGHKTLVKMICKIKNKRTLAISVTLYTRAAAKWSLIYASITDWNCSYFGSFSVERMWTRAWNTCPEWGVELPANKILIVKIQVKVIAQLIKYLYLPSSVTNIEKRASKTSWRNLTISSPPESQSLQTCQLSCQTYENIQTKSWNLIRWSNTGVMRNMWVTTLFSWCSEECWGCCHDDELSSWAESWCQHSAWV